MTILDAKFLLYNHFSFKHTLSLKEQFKELIPISENPELDKAVLESALEDLEETKIVKCVDVCDESNTFADEVWVLTQPLVNYPQTLTLSHPTCQAIVQLLTLAAEHFKTEDILPNPQVLSEKDIQNLLLLLQNALKK